MSFDEAQNIVEAIHDALGDGAKSSMALTVQPNYNKKKKKFLKGIPCFGCGNEGHMHSDRRISRNHTCKHCGKHHLEKMCPNKGGNGGNNGSSSKSEGIT